MAFKTRLERRLGHLRISQRCLLLLSKSMDQRTRTPHLSSLELGGKGRKEYYGELLYQLRHGGTFPQWQEPGRQGICFSSARHGGHVWKLSSAGKSTADDGRPSSVLGCALYGWNTHGQRNKGRQGRSDAGDANDGQSGEARSRGRSNA